MDVHIDRGRQLVAAVALALLVALVGAAPCQAQGNTGEAEWIWSPATQRNNSLPSTCYFRKLFDVRNPEAARIQITCDDRYELHVNGQLVGSGDDWKVLKTYNIGPLLRRGRNVIAVKADNMSGSTVGLMARVTVKDAGHTEVSYSTNRSWKTQAQPFPGWDRVLYNDNSWIAARSFGEFGVTAPWNDAVASNDGSQTKRFTVQKDFSIERVFDSEETGSLVAMTFNEWGEILASREGGPLLLMVDRNRDGIPETVTTYCNNVTNCQGILALNGDVYVTADGPQGAAVYRLRDENRDGRADNVVALMQFEGKMGEHGPHALTLGPDGLIYVIVGNHSAVKSIAMDSKSPYRRFYEGDLPLPKYEDANGNAAGIKAPGGVVVRMTPDGGSIQRVAGGLRNAYDLAFNERGDLFTHDSDMEWDVGLPWYRPTRVLQVSAGAEFGWRSGWSVWPSYYLDSLPAAAETGRGSPTGMDTYEHYAYPSAYHGAIFSGDWSEGRILAIHLKPSGGGYQATSEVFIEGRPLNVTDLAVGPDGWLYFCLGGRNTEGGVYRVVWNGSATVPAMNTAIHKVLHQPQPHSAWGRQQLALQQEQMGDAWERQLTSAARHSDFTPLDRVRALELLQLYGPGPSQQLLIELTENAPPSVRVKATALLGAAGDATATDTLVRCLADSEPAVRRAACEAISQGRHAVPIEKLVAAAADTDRFAAFAARRALEDRPASEWKSAVLDARQVRSFLVGSTALMTAAPNPDNARAILTRAHILMQGYLSDDDFVDLLRVVELTVAMGKLNRGDVEDLARDLAKEYPATDAKMNRELLRLLAQIDESSVLPRLLAELEAGSAPEIEKLHAGLCARFFKTGWTTDRRIALLDYYERVRKLEAGQSLAGYVDNVCRDFIARCPEADREAILADATRRPGAALSLLATMAEKPPAEMIPRLIELDRELAQAHAEQVDELRMGIVAVLGVSGEPAAMAHLRSTFDNEPARRADVAVGLAQQPDGANWPLLVRSLPVLEGAAAQEVLMQLATVDRRPTTPESYKQVIACGLKLGPEGGEHAVKLLEKWTSQSLSPPNAAWDVALGSWQQWFTNRYPSAGPIALATEPRGGTRWTHQDLLAQLDGPRGTHGEADRGALVFEKAQCIKCHRFGGRGESVGPDLSSVASRFQKKDIVDSMLNPSNVISDQYATKSVITDTGLSYTGIIGAAGSDAIVVLQPNGEKVKIRKDSIEEIMPSKKSAMPEGLLNSLSVEEIADLLAYLQQGRGVSVANRKTQQPSGRRQ